MSNQNMVDIIASRLSDYPIEAEQVGRTRFMVLCMDIGANPDEVAEIEKIANSFRYVFSKEGDEVQLSREVCQSPYAEIIENGMSAPLTGGEGGLVHMPDGTTRRSNVPEQLWGHELPEYAKKGTGAFEEMDRMQRTLFPQAARDAAQASRSDFSVLAKKKMIEEIKQARLEGFS